MSTSPAKQHSTSQTNDKKDELTSTPKKTKKNYGRFLIFAILFVICVVYYIYIYETLWKSLSHKYQILLIILLIIFHIFLFLFLTAFYQTIHTLPGQIPLYWGFYIGDDDSKRKRYCLICNAFKPERSHHCSVCNSCVLNMDHHCPWVNNCIGFYNRRFFMQLLFYICLLTLYIDVTMAYFVIEVIYNVIKMKLKYNLIIHGIIIVCGYSAVFTFSIVILMFFKFHVELVLNNSTTIENLDVEHKNENMKYNIGNWNNWIQVFGNDKLYWFMPMKSEKGNPIGDGLNWPKKGENDKLTCIDQDQQQYELHNTNYNSATPFASK